VSPRSSAEDAARTRARIVHAAVNRASALGLESISVRDLADDLRMSKSGVIGPFKSRSELLAAALDMAITTFQSTVIEPTMRTPAGINRMADLVERWVDYLTQCPFPGGCFITAASIELDNRPGRLRDRIAQTVGRWHEFLTREVHALNPSQPVERARDAATTLIGISMATNQELQLLADPAAGPRAKRAMRMALTTFTLNPPIAPDAGKT
jgi:AcrR family transcriptional regulator